MADDIITVGSRRYKTQVFRFDGPVTTRAAYAGIKKEGFFPATKKHGRVYCKTFPNGEQVKNPVLCLGRERRPPDLIEQLFGIDFSGYTYLYRKSAELSYYICEFFSIWTRRWRFLGVQEIPTY